MGSSTSRSPSWGRIKVRPDNSRRARALEICVVTILCFTVAGETRAPGRERPMAEAPQHKTIMPPVAREGVSEFEFTMEPRALALVVVHGIKSRY